jgi:hypothetical protein
MTRRRGAHDSQPRGAGIIASEHITHAPQLRAAVSSPHAPLVAASTHRSLVAASTHRSLVAASTHRSLVAASTNHNELTRCPGAQGSSPAHDSSPRPTGHRQGAHEFARRSAARGPMQATVSQVYWSQSQESLSNHRAIEHAIIEQSSSNRPCNHRAPANTTMVSDPARRSAA